MIDKKVIDARGFLADFNAPVVKEQVSKPIPQPAVTENRSPTIEAASSKVNSPTRNAEFSDLNSAIDKRVDKRVTVALQAELIVDVGMTECTTVDLSAHGVKLKLGQDLFKNIRINIANSGEISGEIMWKDDAFVGIRFDEEQSEIVNVLARVTA